MWYEKGEQSIYGYWLASGWYIHPDYLDAVNMNIEDIGTIEEVETFLKAVKDADLKNADGLSIIPMSGGQNLSTVRTLLSTFGVSVAGSGFDDYGGTMIHFRDHPKTKEALMWLNKLNSMELLDIEFVTQTNQQLQEKVMNSRVALIADSAFNIWTTVTVGENAATKLQYMDYPDVPGVGKRGIYTTYNPYGNGGLAITKECKDPDAVAKLSNWGQQTDKHIMWQAMYGPRGKTWDWDPERGEPWLKVTDEEVNAAMSSGDYNQIEKIGFQIISSTIPTPFDLDLNYFTPAYEEQLAWIFGMHKFNTTQGTHSPVRPFDSLILPADGFWTANVGTLGQVDLEYWAKLINAANEQSFETVWQEYRTQLENRGQWSKVKAEWESEYFKKTN
jgi:ABC-type glycerol-3-phosphate transport system substrate-binding protein